MCVYEAMPPMCGPPEDQGELAAADELMIQLELMNPEDGLIDVDFLWRAGDLRLCAWNI